MKVLVIADYPRPSYQISGIFNERSVKVLKELCEQVEVMAHRPYLPRCLSRLGLIPRWKSWVAASYELRDGISIHRPAYLQIPCIGSAFWIDRGAFFWCRRTARELHRRVCFDAILSFDLFGCGGLAWRIGRDLGIPTCGWATGSDLRKPAGSRREQVVKRAISLLDMVFYQSEELLEIAARLCGTTPQIMRKNGHMVLPRGIPEPPPIRRTEIRARVRLEMGIEEDSILLMTVGRIERDKGVFELLEALPSAVARDPRIYCVMVGAAPADESWRVLKMLEHTPLLENRVKVLPACTPEMVWEYLCAADIFAFPSHKEGMPNSLLEAMAMGIPAVAFSIPPILEIEAGTGGVVIVPFLDTAAFSREITKLAASPHRRERIAKIGKTQVMNRFSLRINMAEVVRMLSLLINTRKSCDCLPSSGRLADASKQDGISEVLINKSLLGLS